MNIGVDIGQKHDPTAIAVVELERRGDDEHYIVRHLERMPLMTAYPDVAARLAAVVASVRARSRQVTLPIGAGAVLTRDEHVRVGLYVDATGVGQPVVDLLRVAGVSPRPVYFTHGDRRSVDVGGITLGKAWLVSRLQALLQTACLHLPWTPEAQALAQELRDYEIRVDRNANDRYGAFRVGAHDDLVTALGLAVQGTRKRVKIY